MDYGCVTLWSYLDKVIKVINGSYIKIHPFVKYSDKYINCKKFYFLVLLGVVDTNEKFTYIYIRELSFVYDSRVLRRSLLWEQIMFNKEG